MTRQMIKLRSHGIVVYSLHETLRNNPTFKSDAYSPLLTFLITKRIVPKGAISKKGLALQV